MPKAILSRVAQTMMVFIAVLDSIAFGQNCKLSAAADWNASLRDVIAGCAFELPSPDGRLSLNVSRSGVISIRKVSEEKREWRGPMLEPPAMLSWSPKSDGFFVDDGEGSGMSSVFRLFRVNGLQILEDDSIGRAAVSLYRHRTNCSASTADPNVWGFGWGARGETILLLVQPTVNEPCGPPDDFMGMVVQTSDGKIVETLSQVQMKKRFGSQLPPSFFSE
jgi:hypothetical protein